MVEMTFKFRVNEQVKPAKRLDRAQLEHQEVKDQLDEVVRVKMSEAREAQEASMRESTAGQYLSLRVACCAAMEEVLPVVEPKKGKVKERSRVTKDLFQQRVSELQKYEEGSSQWWEVKKSFNKQITRACRKDYRQWVNGILDDIALAAQKNDAKSVSKLVRVVSGKCKKFSSKQPSLGTDGAMFENAEELAKAWGVYAQAKFAATEEEGQRAELPCLGPASSRSDDVPSYEVLEKVLESLSNCKAAGWDGVWAEVYKASAAARNALFELVISCVRNEEVPWEMVLGEFVTIYKNKGSTEDMSMYRFICLLTHTYKLLSGWLLRRTVADIEGYLSEHRAGFRSGRGTRDAVYVISALFDEVLAAGLKCVNTFIDYTAAFDSVSHKFMDEALGVALELKLAKLEKMVGGEDDSAPQPVLSWKTRAMFRAI